MTQKKKRENTKLDLVNYEMYVERRAYLIAILHTDARVYKAEKSWLLFMLGP